MERRAVTVQGIVQGVGFRPFVYGLAAELGLAGFVKNQTGRVVIEVEGESAALDRFLSGLETSTPAFIADRSRGVAVAAAGTDVAFRIVAERRRCAEPNLHLSGRRHLRRVPGRVVRSVDRRHGYPFLNCTHCGPRLTIIRGAPYDRVRTTMASFEMCDGLPGGIRGSGQSPLSCAAHGLCRLRAEPQSYDKSRGAHCDGRSARSFVDALCHGRIGALKGLGGLSPGLSMPATNGPSPSCVAARSGTRNLLRHGCRSRRPPNASVRSASGSDRCCNRRDARSSSCGRSRDADGANGHSSPIEQKSPNWSPPAIRIWE